jgi:hypothetical protein
MRAARHAGLIVVALAATCLPAQEADSGVDLRATLTAQVIGSDQLTDAPRSGAPAVAGSRAVAYPTIKFSDHWFATGAVQLISRPYYISDFSTQGYGAKGSVLQATFNYSRVSSRGSLLVRAGEMSSAFGSFLLRYDDADNALVDLPPQYGYYYAPISFLAVAGAQLDATRGKWDGRLQFANSSPANPRSIFAKDQYGNWAAGAGYTIHQGFRVGVSGYRGPTSIGNTPTTIRAKRSRAPSPPTLSASRPTGLTATPPRTSRCSASSCPTLSFRISVNPPVTPSSVRS